MIHSLVSFDKVDVLQGNIDKVEIAGHKRGVQLLAECSVTLAVVKNTAHWRQRALWWLFLRPQRQQRENRQAATSAFCRCYQPTLLAVSFYFQVTKLLNPSAQCH